jgi:hypothetical protein|eukprot:COSAG01_NODE_3604_length_5881_cov_6.368558_5_plen_50_part_00
MDVCEAVREEWAARMEVHVLAHQALRLGREHVRGVHAQLIRERAICACM